MLHPQIVDFHMGNREIHVFFNKGHIWWDFFGELEHILGVIYLGDLKRCRLREPHVGAVVGKI